MDEKNRVFGNNVKLSIVNGGLDEKIVAEHLGYSKYDLWKIMDGRLFLDEEEKADIARELHTTIKDLYAFWTQDEYRAAGCMECCGEFSCNENKTLILDLLDIYCDVQEIIAEE